MLLRGRSRMGNETTPDDTKEGFISEDAGGQVSVSGIYK